MDLRTLKLFCSVMRDGSFSKAAMGEFTTQSTMSKQMSGLEAELGAILFDRLNRGVEPTAAAYQLMSGLEDAIAQLDGLFESVRRTASGARLALNISMCDSMSVNHILPLLDLFRREAPGIELTLSSCPQEEIHKTLISGASDIALVYSTWQRDIKKEHVRAVITRTCPCIYYSSSLFGNTVPESVDDFRHLPFVVSKRASADLTEAFRDIPFTPERVIVADNIRSIQLYVSCGLACAVLGRSQIILDCRGVSIFDLPDAPSRVGTDGVWFKSNNNAALKLFADCVDRCRASQIAPLSIK